ncbi:facilitated trehalose transporter Tret1-like isoform X2 [Aphidius gifuensis]|nr:facilitated trehalose transporter Tret1-like isoform X2 [Aphidius gifuensis]
MGGFSLGCGLGWSAPSIEILKREQDFGLFYNDLIASSFTLGAAFGVLFVPIIVNIIGKKKMMILPIIPFLIGWLLILFAGSKLQLYIIGRLVTGACGGMFCVATPLYSAEISNENDRGTIGVFFHLLLVIGILFAFCTGFTNSLVWITALNGLTPIIAGITMFFIPESPIFHLLKDNEYSARRALQILRGKDADIEPEISAMKAHVDLMKMKNIGINIFFKKPFRKNIAIAYAMMGMRQLSGINAIIFYAVTIFESTGVDLDPIFQGVVLGIVQVIACCISALLIDKIGRKILMLVSEIVMCICLFILASFFMVKNRYPQIVDEMKWLPLISMSIYTLGFSLGAGPVPWSYMVETFPSKLKGQATASAAFINWFFAFLVTLTFETFAILLGNATILFFFSIICAISALFVALCMFETKDKTLAQIQEALVALHVAELPNNDDNTS